jgi:hypothetical protein
MATTTNYGWDTPDDTDLVKDGAAAIRTLGSSIDTTTKNLNPETTLGDIAYRSATSNTNTRLAIGSAGQVLTVAAGVPSWASPSDQTPLTTKGDVFTFSTVDTRLGVGANGTVLTADSAETTGLKWAAPAGGGKVLQVVQGTTTTLADTTSTSFSDSNLTATITPSAASSKILVLVTQDCNKEKNTSGNGDIKLLRGATDLASLLGIGYTETAANNHIVVSMNYLDSPNTTSATTYKTQFRSRSSGVTFTVQSVSSYSSITLLEIGA